MFEFDHAITKFQKPITKSCENSQGERALCFDGRSNGGLLALPLLQGLIHGGTYFRNFTVVQLIRLSASSIVTLKKSRAHNLIVK